MNNILNREHISTDIQNILKKFEENKNDLLVKKGIYIYGSPGSGKTTFIMNILKDLDYDVIKYDAGDIRNKNVIDTITKHTMSDKNIMSMFNKKIRKIVIVMDEIDGMNSGDKGGINTLIKLIRPKKTKKQQVEENTTNPIICIGNYHIDKKIKELSKVCNTIELKTPTSLQMNNIIKKILPNMESQFIDSINTFLQGDLRKLNSIYNIYKNNQNTLKIQVIQNIFQSKSYNDDTKQITQKLINNKYTINDHNTIMNETDRTIVGLLLHENIIDVLIKLKLEDSIPLYLKLLENLCFADYIDRVTFQKQIWQFNEMSSIIKTFHNNKIYHEYFTNHKIKKKPLYNPVEVRFTKVLTKYSTEYNNSTFIQLMCHQLGMDKKDLFAAFLELKNKNSDENNDIIEILNNSDITKLDISRIYRYLDKYTDENMNNINDDNDIEDIN